MGSMTSVPAVHQTVQQRAGEQQQERQIAECVGAMLGHEQEGGNREEGDGDEARLGAPEAAGTVGPVGWMRHAGILRRSGIAAAPEAGAALGYRLT
jgi:hypothetical protein